MSITKASHGNEKRKLEDNFEDLREDSFNGVHTDLPNYESTTPDSDIGHAYHHYKDRK